MGTFSIHNLLKYNHYICICVCVCECECVSESVYLCRLTNVCVYNKSYFRALDLITLVEELDTASFKLDKGIWTVVGTEKPDTLVLRLHQMMQILPHKARDSQSIAPPFTRFSFSPATP
jgi:hypothetical protein